MIVFPNWFNLYLIYCLQTILVGFGFWNMVSFSSLGCPETCYVKQVGPELTEICPISAPQMLELKMWWACPASSAALCACIVLWEGLTSPMLPGTSNPLPPHPGCCFAIPYITFFSLSLFWFILPGPVLFNYTYCLFLLALDCFLCLFLENWTPQWLPISGCSLCHYPLRSSFIFFYSFSGFLRLQLVSLILVLWACISCIYIHLLLSYRPYAFKHSHSPHSSKYFLIPLGIFI